MEEYGLPFYYYENTEGGHAAGANLKQAAHTSALEMVYLTRKLMDNDAPARRQPNRRLLWRRGICVWQSPAVNDNQSQQ